MDPATAAFLAEFIKAGIGYGAAAFFFLELRRESGARVASEVAMREWTSARHEAHQGKLLEISDRDSAVFSKNAEAILALKTAQERHTVAVEDLTREVSDLRASLIRTEGRG